MVSSRVYVGGLNYRVSEKDVERFFRSFGRIRDVIMKNGFAFVEFDDRRDADDAVYEMNGKEFNGERISVEFARGNRPTNNYYRGGGGGGGGRGRRAPWMDKYGLPTRTDYRVIVENLSSRVSWQDLKDFMRQAGEVTYADAHKQHRNEGVVEFSTYGDMKNALHKLDGKELHGRRITLKREKNRRNWSRSSDSRSRSRSKSRSRSRSGHSRLRKRSRSRSSSRRSSRSRSHSREDRRSRSRSHRRSRSRSHRRSRSRSHRRSRSESRGKRSKDRYDSRSKERSNSPVKKRSPTRSRSRDKSVSVSKSVSPKRSLSRSRSRSPVKENGRSRTRSPEQEDDDSHDE